VTWLLQLPRLLVAVLDWLNGNRLKQAGRDEQRAAEAEDALEATRDAQNVEDRVRRYSGRDLADGL
jgi:hypothetical protein